MGFLVAVLTLAGASSTRQEPNGKPIMKTAPIATFLKNGLAPALLALGLATTALAQDRSELDNRVRKLMAQFDALQADAEARIPSERLQQAKGVIMMERTKGGFIFGYEQGFGVAMVRTNGTWSPLAFMSSHQGSFGAQIGGKNTFSVILLMTDAARDRLINPKVNFGGEASGTGGSSSGGVGGSFTELPPVLVFGQAKGLYGGAVVKGGSVSANDKANERYYGRFYSTKAILFDGEVEPSETARALGKKLDEAAK